MNRHLQRRYGQFDLMIGVAAIALGLTPLRFLARELDRIVGPDPYQHIILRWGTYAVTPLAVLTVVALIRSLTPPWPPPRHLVRRPGFLACAVAVAFLAVIGPAKFGRIIYVHPAGPFRDLEAYPSRKSSTIISFGNQSGTSNPRGARAMPVDR
jgi:hypothetical protein